MKSFWKLALLVTVFVLLFMSMEEPMATKESNKLITKATPVLGGGKGNDQLAQRPDNYKPNRPFNPKDKVDAPMRGAEGVPAWMQALMGAAMGGAVNNPVLLGAAMGGQMQQTDKNMDGLAQRTNKNKDRLTLKNKLFDTLAPRGGMGANVAGGSGFGSSYGSNWRGGGGYGGYGGGGDYGYDNSPAWWNAYLRLNNWNI